jgi:hypothetical protein
MSNDSLLRNKGDVSTISRSASAALALPIIALLKTGGRRTRSARDTRRQAKGPDSCEARACGQRRLRRSGFSKGLYFWTDGKFDEAREIPGRLSDAIGLGL